MLVVERAQAPGVEGRAERRPGGPRPPPAGRPLGRIGPRPAQIELPGGRGVGRAQLELQVAQGQSSQQVLVSAGSTR